jgi:hypothetical protein
MTAGETTAGETTAGETTAGETTAGETTAGMSSPTDLSEWNVKFNALFNALAAGQERLCANCPEDNYCSEGDGDMPLTDEEVSCILENLNEDQLSILETALECQAVQIAQFEMCTAEPVCDDSYFTCLGELLNDESCAPEGSSDIDSALPDLGAACFGETACADGSGSFSEDDTCDGFDDCENGEDEQNCD